MTSYFNSNNQSSSNVSEGSSAPASPSSSVHCARSTASLSVSNAASPGLQSTHSVPRFGTWVPNRVFVGGISSSTTEADLQERFSLYGGIKEIKIIRDRAGICKGYGFITFDTEEAAKSAQNETEVIVLKERRLNIAPAVIKQPFHSFSRPYDLSQTGAMMYHNGTSYAFDNGMAFFTNPGPSQAPYGARETTVYSSPFGPTQGSATNHAYTPVMYPYTPQPVAYMPTAQQFYQPLPLEAYFKAAPTSQYVYGSPASLNGTLNGPSPSASPGYGQPAGPPGLPGPPGHSGPPVHPTTHYYHHTGAELFYNGGTHHTQQSASLYPIEGPQSDDYCEVRERDSATPVVSLLKLQERGVEEMEITRSTKKGVGGGNTLTTVSMTPCRPMYCPTGQVGSQRLERGRGRRVINALPSAPSGGPGSRGGRGSVQLRAVTSSPANQTGGGGGGGSGRQYVQRRAVNAPRSTTAVHSRSPAPSAVPVTPASSATRSSPSQSPSPAAESTSVPEDNSIPRHQLPLSPPPTPLSAVRATPTEEGEMCQQMQALAM